MRLRGRAAIVSGGGRGLGRAIALALASEGCDVAVFARTAVEVEAVACEIELLGVKGLAVTGDISQEQDVRAAVDAALARFAGLNIVVNNAGGVHRDRLINCSVEEWDAVQHSQVRGTFLLTRFSLPSLIEAGWGRVVTIGSLAAKMGVPERVAYCTAKYGQLGFTEALDEELRGTGVRAHIVNPGPAATRMRAEGFPNEAPESLIQPEEVAAQVVNLVKLPETAYIREICIYPGQPTRYKD
jgi:3-oxoacyl-[acyl-carrier protein] reductase